MSFSKEVPVTKAQFNHFFLPWASRQWLHWAPHPFCWAHPAPCNCMRVSYSPSINLWPLLDIVLNDNTSQSIIPQDTAQHFYKAGLVLHSYCKISGGDIDICDYTLNQFHLTHSYTKCLCIKRKSNEQNADLQAQSGHTLQVAYNKAASNG